MDPTLKIIQEGMEEFDEIAFYEEEASIFETTTPENPPKVKRLNAEHLGDVQYKLIPKLKHHTTTLIKQILQAEVERMRGMKRIRGEEKPYMWLIDKSERFDGVPSNMDNKKIIGYNTALQDQITHLQETIKEL